MDNVNEDQKKAMQDLQTIKSFLEEGQQALSDNGFHFMLWGILIPVATLGYRALLAWTQSGTAIMSIYWLCVSLAGALVSIIAGVRTGKKSRSKGYAVRVNALFWSGFFLSILVAIVVTFLGMKDASPMLLAYIALILGLAYWIHGSMIQLLWFRLLSTGWWVVAIAIAGNSWNIASTLLASATFALSFIPGFILYRKQAKRSH